MTFQLYRGGQLYWWRKPEYLVKTIDTYHIKIYVSNTPHHECEVEQI
jgi:hypothetical protein